MFEPGGGDRQGLDPDALAGGRQGDAQPLVRERGEEGLEASPALPGRHERLPVCHRQLDRRQGPGDQDRARDHDAARRLALDHEVGADAEHQGLQGEPQHLGHGAEPAGDVRHAPLGHEVALARLGPEVARARGHAMARSTSALRRPASARA